MSVLIDAHIHLDFYDNVDQTCREVEENKIFCLFMTHVPELYCNYLASPNFMNNKYIQLALGYHPILVNEQPFNEHLFITLAKSAKVIGEVGLDYVVARTENSRKKQYDIFSCICKHTQNQIMSIHNRNAEDDVLELLERNSCKNVIFHWYTGKESLIDRILENGYYFSANPMMLNTLKGQKILRKIPINRLLIETDGPFSRREGVILGPKNMQRIYNSFSIFYGVDSIDEQIRQNMKRLFRQTRTYSNNIEDDNNNKETIRNYNNSCELLTYS